MNIIEWSGVQWASHGYQHRTRPSWDQLHRAGHMIVIFWSQEVRTPSQQISPILFLHHEIFRSADFLSDMPLGEWHSDSWLLVGPGQIFQTATYYFKSGRFWVFKAILNPQSLFPIISRPPIANDPPEEKILVQQNYKTHGGLLAATSHRTMSGRRWCRYFALIVAWKLWSERATSQPC